MTMIVNRWLIASILGVLVIVGGGWAVMRSRENTAQVAAVRARGQQVMPFDLDQTLHTFQTTSNGGIETVVARDPANTEQINLIQSHLAYEATQFQQGNFADPAAIHGSAMPGLSALEQGATSIDFEYQALPDGGKITYITTDPELITAIHQWFEAQLADHAHDAVGH